MARLRVLAVAESAAGAEVLGAGLASCDRMRALVVVPADSGAEWRGSDLGERPDVAVVEAGSEGVSGLARIAELAALAIPVVAVLAEFDQAADAWDAGARGLVLATAADAWPAVIEGVAGGGVGLSEDIVAAIAFIEAGAEEMRRSVTAREIEVLRMVADGRTNSEIARALGITESGVKYHLRMCSDKLGVQGRWAVAVAAIQLGVLSGWRKTRGGS